MLCRKSAAATQAGSFHGAPSLSASARSISPSASSARPSKLILGGTSWGDSRGWAAAGGTAVEANRTAWRARGDELGPGVGLRMYANRGDGRRGYGGQRRSRGGAAGVPGRRRGRGGLLSSFLFAGMFSRRSFFCRRFSLFNARLSSSSDGTKFTCRPNHPKVPRDTRRAASLNSIRLHN